MATSIDTGTTDTAAGSAPRAGADARIMAGVRVLLGLMWISNLGWKTPPEFGALRTFTSFAVEHPVFAPYAWLVEHAILPNFGAFGWFTLVMEGLLGAFLLMGLFTRLWALVGAVMSLAITLSVIAAPHEWPWAYYLMIAAHLAVYATAAGRTWGLDALVRPVVLARPGRVARCVEKAV